MYDTWTQCGQTWAVDVGPFRITIDPAWVGVRADLMFKDKPAGIPIGFYPSVSVAQVYAPIEVCKILADVTGAIDLLK